jgi:hypothetical protein
LIYKSFSLKLLFSQNRKEMHILLQLFSIYQSWGISEFLLQLT